jgi:DNA invertase Pin-like site-specific DNA recombinase
MKIYGYVRVSTVGQLEGYSVDEQAREIRSRYSDAEIIVESYSGAKRREKFEAMVNGAEPGDVIVVTKLDRFCRQTKEGLEYLERLMEKGVKVHILNMGLIEDTPIGRLIVTQLLAFAEFERAMILERTTAGKRQARIEKGAEYREGRPPIEIGDEFIRAVEKVERGIMTVAEAVSRLGISRRTWYNKIRELEVEKRLAEVVK